MPIDGVLLCSHQLAWADNTGISVGYMDVEQLTCIYDTTCKAPADKKITK